MLCLRSDHGKLEHGLGPDLPLDRRAGLDARAKVRNRTELNCSKSLSEQFSRSIVLKSGDQ